MKETLRRILSKTMAAFMALSMMAVSPVNMGVAVYADPLEWTDWNLWIGDSTSFTTSNEQLTVEISVPGATAGTATFTAAGTKNGKKTEYDYNEASKLFIFKGENLAGSWSVN